MFRRLTTAARQCTLNRRLAACGGSLAAPPPAAASGPALGACRGASAGGTISIITVDPSNPYWKTEGDVAKADAEKLGYKATVGAHKDDTDTQNQLIDTAITNKSVAIILDPAGADGASARCRRR